MRLSKKMKRHILLLTFLISAICSFGQSVNLNDIVRANTLSPTRTANALDAMKPYTATGTDTYAVSILSGTLYSGSATYANGDMFTIIFTNANATTTPTLNINTDGAISIKDNDGTDPDIGAISGALILRYNGTNFLIVGASGTGNGSLGDFFYNIKDYGAVGDGVTDDRAAIKATIDAAGVLGGVVLIPAGTYHVSDSIVIDHSVRIVGITPVGGTFDSGFGPYYSPQQATSVISLASNKTGFRIIQLAGDSTKPIVSFENLNFVSEGSYTTATTGAFIDVNNMNQSMVIQNCSFLGSYYQVKINSAFYFNIFNNKFVNPFFNCLYISNVIRPDTADSNVYSNIFTAGYDPGAAPKIGIYWYNGGGVRIIQNKFDTMGFAFPLSMDNAFAYPIYGTNPLSATSVLIISQNSIENYKETGIYFNFVAAFVGLIITDNQFAGGQNSAIDITGGSYISIDNNALGSPSASNPAIRLTSVDHPAIGNGNTALNFSTGLSMTGCTNIMSVFDPLTKSFAIGTSPQPAATSLITINGAASTAHYRAQNTATGTAFTDGSGFGIEADGSAYLVNREASSSINIYTTQSTTPINFFTNSLNRFQINSTTIDATIPLTLNQGSTAGGLLRITEDSDLGTNYSEFTVGSQSANITYTLPTAAATADGYVLSSTTAGAMSWVSKTGSINTETTQVGNVGTGEDQLFSYTIPASTLAVNGNSISGTFAGTVAANANVKTLKFKFGATTIMTTVVTNSSITSSWAFDYTIVRTSATTQKCTIRLHNPDGLGVSYYATAGETLSGTVALVLTGEATADNDIVKEIGKVRFED